MFKLILYTFYIRNVPCNLHIISLDKMHLDINESSRLTDWQQVSTFPIVHPRSGRTPTPDPEPVPGPSGMKIAPGSCQIGPSPGSGTFETFEAFCSMFKYIYIYIDCLNATLRFIISPEPYTACAECVQYKVMWILISDYFNINWFLLLILLSLKPTHVFYGFFILSI